MSGIEKDTFDLLTQERVDISIQADATGPMHIDDPAVYSYELYLKYRGISQLWRDELIEDWDFYLGAQKSSTQNTTDKKRQQKSYNVDVIFQAVEQAIALLTSNRPRFSSTGQEDSDTRIAQVFAMIMQYLVYISGFVMKLKQIIKDYYVGSVGWALVWWDPLASNGKGEICLDTIDPKRCFVGPNAKDFFWQDADHMIVETFLTSEMMQHDYNMTIAEVAQFESTPEIIYSSTRVSEMNSGSSTRVIVPKGTYLRLDRYSRVKVPMYMLEKDDERFEMLIDPKQFVQKLRGMTCIVARTAQATNYFVAPRNVASIAKILSQFGQVFHEMQDQEGNTQMISGAEGQVDYPTGFTPVPNSTTYLELATAYQLVAKGIIKSRSLLVDRIKHVASVGQRVLFEEILPTDKYVLVPLINNFDRTVSPVGDVRRVKREQEFINSIRQLVVTHAAVTTNFKIGFPEGRYTEAKLAELFNDPQKRFLPYDAELSSSGLQVIAPPPLPNHLYQLEQQARKNIEERLGIFAMMQGSPTDAPSTYKATVALDEYGQRRIKSKKDDIEEFLNRIGSIVVDFVQDDYTDTRVINIVSPNNKPQTVTLVNTSRIDDLAADNMYRINDITVGRYDIMVVSGSTLPSNRWALLQMYTELYKEGILDQQTVLEKTEVANVDEVMSRIGIINQLKVEVRNLQEQVKSLTGDAQTNQRELMHAKRERDMTVFNKNLEVEQVKAAAARMVYETTLKNMKNFQKGT